MNATSPNSASDIHGEARADETHISTLFFTPTRVYKLLKAVNNGFLDHTTAESRIAAAKTELDCNRRIAPDVYLGLADVVERGELVDRMIVMRRLPADRALSKLVHAADAADHVRAVAKVVAGFHAGLPPIIDPDGPGSLRVQRQNWEDSFATMDQFVGPVLDEDADDRVRSLVRRYLDGHEELFASRVSGGFVRDGHGDLLADDIFCLEDGPQILDCLAFRDDFRIGDVLSDAAFLAMDLHRLAGPDLARVFMHWYCNFTNEHHPGSLGHHYVAYRAHVRSKVACLRWQQGAREFAAVARMYHMLALDQLERGQTRLIMVGGGPATGKTTIAGRLGDHFGWPVLSSDTLRKDLAGAERNVHEFAEPDKGIYTPEITDATYAELIREAAVLMAGGVSVVLDASWTKSRHREAARAAAVEYEADVIEVECQLSPSLAKERLVRRMADAWNPSDATVEVIDHLGSQHDDWTEAIKVDTSRPVDETVQEAIDAVLSPQVSSVTDRVREPSGGSANLLQSDFWRGWIALDAAPDFGRPRTVGGNNVR